MKNAVSIVSLIILSAFTVHCLRCYTCSPCPDNEKEINHSQACLGENPVCISIYAVKDGSRHSLRSCERSEDTAKRRCSRLKKDSTSIAISGDCKYCDTDNCNLVLTSFATRWGCKPCLIVSIFLTVIFCRRFP